MDRENWQAMVHGDARVRHDLATPHHHQAKCKSCWLNFDGANLANNFLFTFWDLDFSSVDFFKIKREFFFIYKGNFKITQKT